MTVFGMLFALFTVSAQLSSTAPLVLLPLPAVLAVSGAAIMACTPSQEALAKRVTLGALLMLLASALLLSWGVHAA